MATHKTKATKLNTSEDEAHFGGPDKQLSTSSSKRFSMVLILVAAVIVIVVVTIISNHKSTTNALGAPAQVQITATGFNPSTVTISPNQGVVWTNTTSSASHEVASDPYPTDNGLAGFDESTPIGINGTFGFVFDSPGTYTYHDNLNPYTYHGTVVVK